MHQERYRHYRRQGQIEEKQTGGFRRVFVQQGWISLFLFLFCMAVFFLPGAGAQKAENSVRLIVGQTTDLRSEWENIKQQIVKEDALETVQPVSNLVAPVSGVITKGFGVQDASGGGFHYGVDLSVAEGATVLAAGDGAVVEMATNAEYGSFIVLAHSDEIFTLYGNLGEMLPNVGDKVAAGQPLARTEKDMLYFELRRNDTYLDPAQFIRFQE